MRREINLTIRVAIKDTCSLVVEIENGLVVSLILEKHLVRADDLSVFLEARLNSVPKIDNAFDAFGWQK